jgi:hypothetical protein
MGDTNEIVVVSRNGKDDRLNQFSGPCNIYVDEDHSVYVSDYGNHRVITLKNDKAIFILLIIITIE